MRTLSEQLASVRIDEANWGILDFSSPGGAIFGGRTAAMVHVVLRGRIYLALPNRSEPIALKAGSSAFVVGGSRHRLLSDPDASATVIRYFDQPHASDRIATIRVGAANGTAECQSLAGAFDFDRLATMRLTELLPEMAHGSSLVLVAPDMTPSLPAFVAQHLEGPGATAFLNRLADFLLVMAVRRHVAWPISGLPTEGRRQVEPELIKAVRLMQMQPARQWTVAALADRVMMSRSSFAAKFSARLGEPPMAYLTRIRMNRAAELVARTDQSLATIAASLGYASLASFTHLFKRWHGDPPGRFRKQPASSDGGGDYLESSHWQIFM